MKRRVRLYVFIFLGLCFGLTAFSQEVRFEEASWAATLQKAKAENKPIFLDIYASWCGPCKLLDKNVYPNKEVADFMNKNFINLKIDGEEGEGPAMLEKFGLSSYPTLFFIKPNGDKFYSFEGYREPEAFLEEVKLALEKGSQPTVSDFEKEFKAGKREKAFLEKYLNALYDDNYEHLYNADVLDAYVATLSKEDLQEMDVKKTLWNQLPSYRFGGKAYDFFRKNITKIKEANFSEEEEPIEDAELLKSIDSYIAYYDAKRAIAAKDEALFEKSLQNFRRVAQEGTKWFSSPKSTEFSLKRSFYETTGNTKKVLEVLETEANQLMQAPTAVAVDSVEGDPTASILNSAAWYFFQNTTDDKHLQEALKWSEKSIELEESEAYYDTYANLLFVLDRGEEALAAERKAIDLAFDYGEETTDYWKTLLRMKSEIDQEKERTVVEQTLDGLKKDLASYQKLTKELRIDEFMDYVPEKMFEVVPEESLCSLFYQLYHNKEMPMQIQKTYPIKFYPIEFLDGTAYTLVKIGTELVADLTTYAEDSSEKDVEGLVEMYKVQFGESNIRFDKEQLRLMVKQESFMFAVAEAGDTSWKFINRDKKLVGILDVVVPKEIQEKFE